MDEVARFKREAIGVSPWNKMTRRKNQNPLNFHTSCPSRPRCCEQDTRILAMTGNVSTGDASGRLQGLHPRWSLPGAVSYWFETPWCPPFQFLETVSDLFSRLRFELVYFEEMNHYHGAAVAQDGEVQNDFVNQAP